MVHRGMRQDFLGELLQTSVGVRDRLSRMLTSQEWEWLLNEADRHAIVGILACGVIRLPKEQQPPKGILLQWMGPMLFIEQKNKLVTRVCQNLCRRFEADGFACCVLKGQANHAYYPSEMGARRHSGDIDIWIQPKVLKREKGGSNPTREVVEYVQEKMEMTGLCWLHANCDVEEVPVEVHFRPSFFSRPIRNRRFQRHFSDITSCVEWKSVGEAEIPAMKVEEDVIYQMNHIFRHLIDEGIGLRQIVDYYYVLKRFREDCFALKDSGEPKVKKVTEMINWLGMNRFAKALMYVLKELLGMPEEYLLYIPSEKDGKFLMDEILMSGNFGHQDPRMEQIASGGYLKRRFSQARRRFKRNLRFLTSYPGEVLWEPVVRVEHFAWKKLKLWE